MSSGWYPPPSKPRPVEGGLQAPITVQPPTAAPGSLLDHVPAIDLDVRGTELTALLRPAYAAFGDPATVIPRDLQKRRS